MSNYLLHRQKVAQGLEAKESGKKEPKPIARISEKKKAQAAEEKKLTALDREFYTEIWTVSPHTCFECGRQLGREPLTLFFHHLLAKSHYPEFRHTPENIVILCPDHHAQAESDLDKVPKTKRRREQVYKELIG